jgi:hypothetical protein
VRALFLVLSRFNSFLLAETPKDPGIPNNFPYKDQILAEIAEERRKVRAPNFDHFRAGP